MNDLNNGIDQAPGSIGRRDLLKKGAAAGAIVWTAPLILSDTALAAGGGTPECRPTITPSCWVYDCEQGQKYMPGMNVTVSTCGCDTAQRPTMCVQVSGLNSTCAVTAIWAEPTKCGPSAAPDDTPITAGAWYCVPADDQAGGFEFFFGQARNGGENGSIDEIPNGCIITFRLTVWAGGCPTEAGDDAYTCEVYDVKLMWNNDDNTVVCAPLIPGCPDCGIYPVTGDPGCPSGAPCGPC